MPADPVPHISVCVCTYKRSQMLAALLKKLVLQETGGLFEYSIVAADNDRSESSCDAVHEMKETSKVEISYCVEPTQNIALARNRALANARGNYVAFIDDDEFPSDDWLLTLFRSLQAHKAHGVLGPVLPQFDGVPPAWVKKGGFCDRPSHPTGWRIDWTHGRTGNLLFKRDILDGVNPVFRAEFGGGGEDRDFFRRMIAAGKTFVWCNEAPVYEWVPPSRWRRSFMIRRALLRGKMSLQHGAGAASAFKSLVAIIGYGLALPVSWIIGQHLFMKFLIKGCDHAGKVLAFVGINPVRQNYILE